MSEEKHTRVPEENEDDTKSRKEKLTIHLQAAQNGWSEDGKEVVTLHWFPEALPVEEARAVINALKEGHSLDVEY